MSIILKQAAADAEAQVAANLAKQSISGTVRAAQLSGVVKGVGPIATNLWTQTGIITRSGMHAVGELAADQSLDLDFLQGMPSIGVLQMVDATYFNAHQAVEDLISRHTAGFSLADRIYAEGKESVRAVGKIIDQALVQQLGHQELSKLVKGYFDPAVPGGASYAAHRLARTEIGNAHHETTKRLAADKPWVLGMRWYLSGSHPRPDECNDFAEKDHDGLGPGVFKKQNVPSKPHPNCLCYLGHIQESEKDFMNKLASGKYDDYMKSMGAVC
jgi:hypothetical protein